MGTYVGAAGQDSERLAAGRAWVRWGMAAAVTGMLAWLAGFALIPPDAKLDKGEQHLAGVLRAHTGQLYAAALLAVLGAVLLAAFFAVLTRLVPEGSPGWVCCACPWPGA
jgi:Zn-dependent protease